VPIPRGRDLFSALCILGERLVNLHLLRSRAASLLDGTLSERATVGTLRYTPTQPGGTPGRVWLNARQSLEGMSAEVWEFRVGGYPVCRKWLQDRKGRTLSTDDLSHYYRMAAAIAESLAILAEIDEALEERGGWS